MKEYIITWFIENYSYCWHKNGEALISPEFTADSLEGTKWTLQLYPRGKTDGNEDSISLFLARRSLDDGPIDFPLKYELSILALDGSTLQRRMCEYTFRKGKAYGPSAIAQVEDLLFRKSEYLAENVLKVRLIIKKGQGSALRVDKIVARSRIGIEKVSFYQEVERFSFLKPNEKKTIQFNFNSEKRLTLLSSLYFSGDSLGDEKLVVEVTPTSDNHTLSMCKLSFIDSSGEKIECGEIDNQLYSIINKTYQSALNFTRSFIMRHKSDYLQDDKLSLLYECVFSSGIEFQKIEKTLHELPFYVSNLIAEFDHDKDAFAERLSAYPNGLDDLREMLNNGLLTDVALKTETKSFAAHKVVLCARSSVFKAMLTSDMREKYTNRIEIDELEDDILGQLLHFLYSDDIENLDWESAVKLYYAGDKYAIEKLKLFCSSFFVRNLTTTSVCELLLLADAHNDNDLKKVAEDFIMKNDQQVFRSEEWGNLMEINPLLVSKTMCLKYVRES